MVSFRDLILKQIEMLNAGQVLEALDLFFADYGTMYSNGELFATGLVESQEKQRTFIENAKNIKGDISDLVIDDKSEFCVFRNQTSFDDPDGHRQHINGLHVQMWASGKIASEWYFDGELMDEILTAGIYSDPAHILELI